MKTCEHYKNINLAKIEQALQPQIDVQLQICNTCDIQLSDDLKKMSPKELESLVYEHKIYLDSLAGYNQTANDNQGASTGRVSHIQRPVRISRLGELLEKIEIKYQNGVLICLMCLNVACGRYEKKHALKHVEQEKSHTLVLSSKAMTVWCYTCDDDLQTILNSMQNEDTEKEELHNFLEKLHQIFGRLLIKPRRGQRLNSGRQIDIKDGQNEEDKKEDVQEYTEKDLEDFHICYRGFKNLGNTCFFNSTMQCLNASRDFVFKYVLPKTQQFPFKNNSSMNVLLRSLFFDVRNGKGSYNPSLIFSGVCKRNSSFRGFQQQDAHDLLVNFLDMLVQEHDQHMKRSKQEKMKGQKKSYVEEVFVLCLDCRRVSRIRDPTFDMSVTISFKQNTPQSNSKLKKILSNNSITSQQVSIKATSSKVGDEMKQTTKMNMVSMNQIKSLCNCLVRVNSTRSQNKTEYQQPNVFYSNNQTVQQQEIPDKVEEPIPQIEEKLDKQIEATIEKKDEKAVEDQYQEAKTSDTPYKGASTNASSNNTEKQSDQTTISKEPQTIDNLRSIHSESTNKDSSTPTPQDPQAVLLNKGITSGHMMFEEGKRFGKMFDMEKTPFLEDGDKFEYFEPAPKAKFDDGTLEGCLYNSVKIESLVDKQNLYLCEHCTEEKYGKKSKKQHRTQALKKLMLIEPPNNLIINLKRFTQQAFSFSKNSKRIAFPLILELDDFMIHTVNKEDNDLIKQYEQAKTDADWQPKYQYRLFGVVSHSGSMSGGHYIAYTSYHYKGKRYWFYMSDSQVDQVDEKNVLSCEAYILFYQRMW
ncbi:ubiquitin carboxyl-terminal hydrolase 16 isoform x2 [Stylonychia lemnae]|uniref:Ubiquitin carboxyl-terminal hydrolase n=1 Tax=Stylonychia lemnae TaxID=5949 RepID=A0A078A0G0_STYLE|nr:ubiquitin carboxyl-terminal hydrolase 16 isoform x2 [Stylonychia lemnae]|eukprot:CDW75691.1 ubiquitin carboxyl-terminal hydrolase 16 isoform x2 [Stylonychia lemnae]